MQFLLQASVVVYPLFFFLLLSYTIFRFVIPFVRVADALIIIIAVPRQLFQTRNMQ